MGHLDQDEFHSETTTYLSKQPTSKWLVPSPLLRASHPPTMQSGDASNATPKCPHFFLEVDGVDITIGDGSAEPFGGRLPRRRGP